MLQLTRSSTIGVFPHLKISRASHDSDILEVLEIAGFAAQPEIIAWTSHLRQTMYSRTSNKYESNLCPYFLNYIKPSLPQTSEPPKYPSTDKAKALS